MSPGDNNDNVVMVISPCDVLVFSLARAVRFDDNKGLPADCGRSNMTTEPLENERAAAAFRVGGKQKIFQLGGCR